MKQLHSFHNLRKFIILWLGQSVSALGSAMTNYALIIWAYQQQGTASSIAMLSVCSIFPPSSSVFSPARSPTAGIRKRSCWPAILLPPAVRPPFFSSIQRGRCAYGICTLSIL